MNGDIDQQQISCPKFEALRMTYSSSNRLALQELLVPHFRKHFAVLGDVSSSSKVRLKCTFNLAILQHAAEVVPSYPDHSSLTVPYHRCTSKTRRARGVHMLGFSPKTHRFTRPRLEVMRKVSGASLPQSGHCAGRCGVVGGGGPGGSAGDPTPPHRAGELCIILGCCSRQTRTCASASYLATYRLFRGSPYHATEPALDSCQLGSVSIIL